MQIVQKVQHIKSDVFVSTHNLLFKERRPFSVTFLSLFKKYYSEFIPFL